MIFDFMDDGIILAMDLKNPLQQLDQNCLLLILHLLKHFFDRFSLPKYNEKYGGTLILGYWALSQRWNHEMNQQEFWSACSQLSCSCVISTLEREG